MRIPIINFTTYLLEHTNTYLLLYRSKVIDVFKSQLNTDQHALAFFYCNYRDAARMDPASALRALVKQLCLHSPSGELPGPVLSIYETRDKNGHQSGALHPNESRDLIQHLSTGFAQTTIVIDALDECNRDTRGHLFQILKHIVASTSAVRIFITGRSDGDIQRILGDFPNHYIEARDNQGDIETYINSEIERCCREKALLDGDIDKELESDIVSTLMKGADGMYVLVLSFVPSFGSAVIWAFKLTCTLGFCGFICSLQQYAVAALLATFGALSGHCQRAWRRLIY